MKNRELIDLVADIQTLLETKEKHGKLSRKSNKKLCKNIDLLEEKRELLKEKIDLLNEALARHENLKVRKPATYWKIVRVIEKACLYFLSHF